MVYSMAQYIVDVSLKIIARMPSEMFCQVTLSSVHMKTPDDFFINDITTIQILANSVVRN